jgi:hypothetical protein
MECEYSTVVASGDKNIEKRIWMPNARNYGENIERIMQDV